MPVVYLNFNTGALATPADRSSNCVDVQHLQVGAPATLSVKVRNTDASAISCTVQFFTKKGPAPAAAIPTFGTVPSNPPPLVSIPPNGDQLFTVSWAVQGSDFGTTFIYAQIQSPGAAGNVELMGNAANAREAVAVLPLALKVALAAQEPASAPV